MVTCKYCGCWLPDGVDTCIACGKPQNQKQEDGMTNLTVKTNLLVMLEEYTSLNTSKDNKDTARKTIALALKAIDAYPKDLDE